MAGHAVSTTFSEEIYKHTEGNPFFIGESIRALIEEGKLTKVGDRWQRTVALEELGLPQSVRLLIERRLAHLSPECRVTLAYAAVLGRQFNSTVLCQACNLSDDTIAEHIDDAIRTQILMVLDGNSDETGNEHAVSQDADLIFTHDKIREVLALWLNPLRRRTAHRQIAQSIETRYASRLETFYSKLAYHHQMAEQITKAVEYLLKAADRATSVYAFVEAASFMEKAVELLLGEENRPQRAELLRKLSVDVYLYIGKPDKAIKSGIAACTLWQELGDSVKEAESRLDVSFSFHWMGRETDAIEYIKRALSCLVSAPQETRLLAKAYVQWGLSATASGDIPQALEQLQLADELHAQIGGNDPFIAVVSLWARSWCAFASGTLQEMLDYALQSAALCRNICMFAWEPMMTYSAAWALMLMGRLEEGAHIARETLEKAQRQMR
jgi:tetratricopeptide (TPR) repeat protein